MQSVNDCFDKIKADCFKYFTSQKIKLKNKDKLLKSFFIPICFWISKKKILKDQTIIGLSGGQGSGKTTVSSVISIILQNYFKYNVCNISIDDFYKTKKERELISIIKHPLLITRGVPGTHDISMLLKFFEKIKKKKFKKFKFPKFNKATDDRYKKNYWNFIKSKPQIVIFEGWCVGAKPQNYNQLKKPVNKLEKSFDKNKKWRKFVNQQLKTTYNKLFNKIDELLYLNSNNFNSLKKWRIKQEKKLLLKYKDKKNLKIMKKNEVLNFMLTYERITKHMSRDVPKYASIVLKLNNNQQITKIKFN